MVARKPAMLSEILCDMPTYLREGDALTCLLTSGLQRLRST
jgi:hypothetical protein